MVYRFLEILIALLIASLVVVAHALYLNHLTP